MDVIQDYEGRAIRLGDERWQRMIQHPETAGTKLAVQETVRTSQVVVQSLEVLLR